MRFLLSFLLLSAFATLPTVAQSFERQSIVATSGDDNRLTYSFGDAIVLEYAGASYAVTAGSQPGDSRDSVTRVHPLTAYNVSVYPNPCTDRLTITYPGTGAAELCLLSATGAVAYSIALPRPGVCALPPLAAGLYVLTLRQGTGAYRQLLEIN